MISVIPSDTLDEAALLTRVSSLASGFARRLVRRGWIDDDAADDLVQRVALDCLVRLRTNRWRVHPTLEGLVASMTWRKFAWGLRGERNRQERDAQHLAEREADTPEWMDPERMLEVRDDDARRRRALAELPAHWRDSWRLVRDEGATFRAAAKTLGISRGAVAWQVAKADRHLLKQVFGVARKDVAAPTKPYRPPRRGRRRRAEAHAATA